MDADIEKREDVGSSSLRAAAGVAVAALFVLVLALTTTFITDTDVFWHLAAGDRIRGTGTIPRSEPFSYTAFGHRWVDIHWLFQVVLSFVHEKGGWRALEILRSALILGVFVALFRRCRRATGPATAGWCSSWRRWPARSASSCDRRSSRGG